MIPCPRCAGHGAIPENGSCRTSAAPEHEPLLSDWLTRDKDFSSRTFGPGKRTKGLIDHITKELREIAAKPDDLTEWIDVAILALDGYWRHGGDPKDIMRYLEAKLAKNIARKWPTPTSEDAAIEHDRTQDDAAPEREKVTMEELRRVKAKSSPRIYE